VKREKHLFGGLFNRPYIILFFAKTALIKNETYVRISH
jgi:hypothetical protein